jgi:hypothetical protein
MYLIACETLFSFFSPKKRRYYKKRSITRIFFILQLKLSRVKAEKLLVDTQRFNRHIEVSLSETLANNIANESIV